MNVVDTAKEQVKHIAEKVVDKVHPEAAESRIQAITINRSRHEVVQFFQQADRLSEIFGDVAEVQSIGPDRLRWKFVLYGSDGPDWECVIADEDDIGLRFVDVNPEKSVEIVLQMRDAPQDRGTEVIGRVSSPAPGALTGPLLFKALYRARALLMTGEVPTIKHNPSARRSER
jgi:hypothetical protein